MQTEDTVEQLRLILESQNIFPKVGKDCIEMKEANGISCRMDCPHFTACDFYASMCVDMVGCSIAPSRFPDGFVAHLINSIELYKTGIRVGIVDIQPEDVEDE